MRRRSFWISTLLGILVGWVAIFPQPSFAVDPIPLLHTTLDSVASVTTPVRGNGSGSGINTTPADDFVNAKFGKGIRVDTYGEYVRFKEVVGPTQNVELTRGTVDFWYQPFYASTDGIRHEIFKIGTIAQPGISLTKRTGGVNSNDLWIQILDANRVKKSTFFSGSSYSWAPNQWVNVRVTWDTTLTGNQSVARLYLDGVEIPPKVPFATGPITMPAENPNDYIYIGNTSSNTVDLPATGLIDEFKIFDQVVPPTGLPSPTPVASPTPTPPSSPTPTPISTPSPSPTPTTNRPNIVVVISDDQRFGTMTYLANTMIARLEAESVRFQKAFATTPTCCPSRSTILTGQYSHHHGVLQNEPPNGGVTMFNSTSAIPVWLNAAGYRTGIFGKYLNGYGCLSTAIPPGWNEWHVFNICSRYVYYNYTLNENGATTSFGSSPNDYSTKVLGDRAVSFIQSAPPNQPLFLYFTPAAPHEPSTPEPQDVNAWPWVTYNHPPSFNEADVSDKPQWVRDLPQLTPSLVTTADDRYKQAIKSLVSVDRAIGRIVDALTATGRMQNTMLIFMSDNGLSLGEHRWFVHDGNEYGAKECVYEECIKVPLWIRLPEKISRQDNHLVGNIDLAPTILDAAQVSPPPLVNGYPVDGKSLIPLIQNPNIPWRSEILIEMLGGAPSVSFSAVRTSQYIYAEYENGNKELYDLVADPYQLNNLCPASQNYSCPGFEAQVVVLKAALELLKN